MKLQLIRKIFVGIIFVSSITTTIFVTYKVVETNNVKVETSSSNNDYLPIKINSTDRYKIMSNKNDKMVFNLPNMEYFLINKTLNLYPELSNRKFSFKVNDYNLPTKLTMEISTAKVVKWFYSII